MHWILGIGFVLWTLAAIAFGAWRGRIYWGEILTEAQKERDEANALLAKVKTHTTQIGLDVKKIFPFLMLLLAFGACFAFAQDEKPQAQQPGASSRLRREIDPGPGAGRDPDGLVRVWADERVYPLRVEKDFMRNGRGRHGRKKGETRGMWSASLSPRQYEVAVWFGRGLGETAIAKKLGYSTARVQIILRAAMKVKGYSDREDFRELFQPDWDLIDEGTESP